MQYQLFIQYKEEFMKYQRDNQDYTHYLDKVMQLFFQNRLNTLIPINNNHLNFWDYSTKNNYYQCTITKEFTSILPDLQKKWDWEFSDTLLSFYMEKGKIYFMEMREGILRIEVLDSAQKVQTYIYDSLATNWLFENNLLNLSKFLNPQKALKYIKLFERNYLNPDFFEETILNKETHMLPAQITDLKIYRLQEHLEKTKIMPEFINNEGIKL